MTVETLPAGGIYIELLGRMDVNENVDDLFDYDAGLDDILRQVEQDTNKTTAASSSQAQPNPGKGVLGIDDELQVSRKRAPVAQLDEAR